MAYRGGWRSYSHPQRRPTRRPGRRGRRAIVALLLIGTAVAGWTWKIRTIEVDGATLNAPGAIRDATLELLSHRRWAILPRTSVPLTGTRQLSRELRERFALAAAVVDRRSGGVLHIQITEQPAVAVAVSPGQGSGLLGPTGQVIARFSEGAAPPAADAITIRISGELVPVGGSVFPPQTIALLQMTWQELRAAGGPLMPNAVVPRQDAARTFDIQVTGGAVVTVSADEPADAQVTKLRAALAARPSSRQRAVLRSIDVRYGDRVYVQ